MTREAETPVSPELRVILATKKMEQFHPADHSWIFCHSISAVGLGFSMTGQRSGARMSPSQCYDSVNNEE
jgi:hypothetical protein